MVIVGMEAARMSGSLGRCDQFCSRVENLLEQSARISPRVYISERRELFGPTAINFSVPGDKRVVFFNDSRDLLEKLENDKIDTVILAGADSNFDVAFYMEKIAKSARPVILPFDTHANVLIPPNEETDNGAPVVARAIGTATHNLLPSSARMGAFGEYDADWLFPWFTAEESVLLIEKSRENRNKLMQTRSLIEKNVRDRLHQAVEKNDGIDRWGFHQVFPCNGYTALEVPNWRPSDFAQ